MSSDFEKFLEDYYQVWKRNKFSILEFDNPESPKRAKIIFYHNYKDFEIPTEIFLIDSLQKKATRFSVFLKREAEYVLLDDYDIERVLNMLTAYVRKFSNSISGIKG